MIDSLLLLISCLLTLPPPLALVRTGIILCQLVVSSGSVGSISRRRWHPQQIMAPPSRRGQARFLRGLPPPMKDFYFNQRETAEFLSLLSRLFLFLTLCHLCGVHCSSPCGSGWASRWAEWQSASPAANTSTPRALSGTGEARKVVWRAGSFALETAVGGRGGQTVLFQAMCLNTSTLLAREEL